MILPGRRIQRNGHGVCALSPVRTRSLNKQARLFSRIPVRDVTSLAVPDQPFHIACAVRRSARLPRADLPEGERRL